MINILTSIGNPILNNELRKIKNFNIIKNDIKYENEILKEINKNKIDYLIINEKIKSKNEFSEIIKNILIINSKIKIIIILKNKEIEKQITALNIYKIYYEDNFNLQKLKEDIYSSNNKEFNNKVKIKKEKDNKVISVVGISQVGKTYFILQLLQYLKNIKILIIDCDFKFKDIQIILNSKTNSNKIFKTNSEIDLINIDNKKNKNQIKEELNKFKNNYDLIIIDNNYNLFYNFFLEQSNKIFFLINPDILNINKTKKIIEKNLKKDYIEKTKIIINKKSLNSLDKKIVEKTFNNFKVGGCINYSNLNNKIIEKVLLKKQIIKIIKDI